MARSQSGEWMQLGVLEALLPRLPPVAVVDARVSEYAETGVFPRGPRWLGG